MITGNAVFTVNNGLTTVFCGFILFLIENSKNDDEDSSYGRNVSESRAGGNRYK